MALVISVHKYGYYGGTGDSALDYVYLQVALYYDSFAAEGFTPIPANYVNLYLDKDTAGSNLNDQKIDIEKLADTPGFSQGYLLDQSIYTDSTYNNREYWALDALSFGVGLFNEPIGIAMDLILLAGSWLPQPGPDYQDASWVDLYAWSSWHRDQSYAPPNTNPLRQYCFNSYRWFLKHDVNPSTYFGLKVWARVSPADPRFGYYVDLPPVYLRINHYNQPPLIPSTPSGPTSGYPGSTYTYTTSTTDPEGDVIWYEFDWDDGSYTTVGPYASGTTASASHSWSGIHTHDVRVRAKDSAGLWSDWSPSLLVYIRYGGGGGGQNRLRSPTLFVWNGSGYVEEATFDLHGDSDVTDSHRIEQLLVPEEDHYLLSLRELNESISHIDYVKLYAVDTEGEIYESHLTHAMHNELGNVKQLLKFDDDNRADLGPSQIIDLKFNAPEIENIAYFILEIQGYEPD